MVATATTKICQDCGKEIRYGKRCDRCRKYTNTCEICGKPCTRGSRFCAACAKSQKFGSNNPSWRGGVSKNFYFYKKTSNERHPEMIKAHKAVAYAIKKGKLTRQPCEVCGETSTQAHHDDYAKPLEVRWLCEKHHMEIHGHGV